MPVSGWSAGAATVHHFTPFLSVVTVPPFLVQSASVVPTAVPILKLFDLLALTVVAADAPWAVSTTAAKATNDAHSMDESFMVFPAMSSIEHSRRIGQAERTQGNSSFLSYR
jgi:outer membrane scaffolding protein for murein synthesis (MipA/OmpV family)